MLYTLRFFSSKCSLFHNAKLFGSCIIHILYTGCAKIKKKNSSGTKGLIRTASDPDMQKIRIIGIFLFENRLHWQFEVRQLLFMACACD